MPLKSIGSIEYWRDPASYPEGWQVRAEQAARFIEPGTSVLDIGCGPHMALRKFLPAGCTYFPADIVMWSENVSLVDIDANIFPSGDYDFVMLLGVLEYIRRPDLVFHFAEMRAKMMILSYTHPHPVRPNPAGRIGMGWINSFSIGELDKIAARRCWRIEQSELFRESEHTRHMIHKLCPERIFSPVP